MGRWAYWQAQLNFMMGGQEGFMEETTFELRCEGRQQVLITDRVPHRAYLVKSSFRNLNNAVSPEG